MNTAILGVGSTADNASDMFMEAIVGLIKHGCALTGLSSKYTVSEPYLNCVIGIECYRDYEGLVAATKEIERTLGRTPELKAQGIVPIDIDVVVYNGEVKRERDFNAPYFTKGYEEIVLHENGTLI